MVVATVVVATSWWLTSGRTNIQATAKTMLESMKEVPQVKQQSAAPTMSPGERDSEGSRCFRH